MKRTTKYVALDVHLATTLASVRQESGRVIALATPGSPNMRYVVSRNRLARAD